MQIDITTSSLLIFLIISIGSALLLWQNYIKRESIKTTYTLLFTQNRLFYLRYIFLVLSLIVISIGVFKIGYFGEDTSAGDSLDIVFVLDVSKSMNTIDVKNGSYSRLNYSKIKIGEYMNQHSQNRYGLVIFAGDALSLSPLSNNIDHMFTNLSQVSFTNIAKQGTDLATALELGYARFGISESDTGRALILISDGGDPDDTLNEKTLSEINSKNIPSFVFGVGSKSGGSIPVGRDPFGETVFQTYQGQQVITKINTSLLKELADILQGEYNLVSTLGDQLDTIATKANQNAQHKYKKSINSLLAALSFILFILYLVFPYIWKLKK